VILLPTASPQARRANSRLITTTDGESAVSRRSKLGPRRSRILTRPPLRVIAKLALPLAQGAKYNPETLAGGRVPQKASDGMTKKKRLVLSRETLRSLDSLDLKAAFGGDVPTVAFTQCGACPELKPERVQ
jgi:hypothetical protein